MNNTDIVIYFGAAGAGLTYCEHTKKLPDFFVDNDTTKWGSSLNGIEIKNPTFLKSIIVKKIIITSGYVKQIMPQLLDMGIDKNKIHIPPKSHLGLHIFENENNRIEAANKLFQIMENLKHKWNVVSVGGTALGFARDNDFIHWDVDIDLFAPEDCKSALFNLLEKLDYKPEFEENSIKANMLLENGIKIPLGIDFFNSDSNTFIDRFEDYYWEWPTLIFTQCKKIKVHGQLLNIPASTNKYLTGVYGKNWSTPNLNFNYSDYSGKIS